MECPCFQILAYGIYDSRIATPKLTRSPVRQLHRFELELITEDLGGTSYIGDTPYPLKKGLFICGKPGQTRYSHLPIYCHYVHIRTEDPGLQHMLCQLPDACQLSDPAPIQAVFRELVSQPGNGLLTASLVLKLLSLLQQVTATELRSSFSPSHRAMLLETESYIRNHLAEDLSLEQLAHRARFSPSRFHTLFTAWFGKPPHAFVSSCRIEAAKASLRSDRRSMIEIAGECGFSSQSHFCAQFKKATGQTPLQYRNAMLSRLVL